MIVKKVNGKPDIPEGTEYESVVSNPNGETFTVILSKEYYRKQNESIKAATQMYVAEKILAGTLPKERLPDFAMTFDIPEKGRTYKKEWILRDPETNELFEVIKETHTWLGIYTLDQLKSEFVAHRPEGEVSEWKQPQGAHDAYKIGEKVSYKDQIWESQINANVTVPDGDVPYNRYWKPVNK